MNAQSIPLREAIVGDSLHRQLLESIFDQALLMLNLRGQILTWNSGAEGLTGFTAAEAIGSCVTSLFPPEDQLAGRPSALFQRAMKAHQTSEVGWFVHRAGHRMVLRVVVGAIYTADGTLDAYSFILQEVVGASRHFPSQNAREIQNLRTEVARLNGVARAYEAQIECEVARWRGLEKQLEMELQRLQTISAVLNNLEMLPNGIPPSRR